MEIKNMKKMIEKLLKSKTISTAKIQKCLNISYSLAVKIFEMLVTPIGRVSRKKYNFN